MKTDNWGHLMRKGCATLSIVVIACHLLLVITSWIITSANPELHMRSLLSGEGIRWFVGHAVDHLANPVGVWLLLLSLTYGAVRESNIIEVFSRGKPLPYRKRFALRLTAVEVCIVIVIIALLTMTPHAILLGVTGTLTTGSFVHGIVPILLLCVTLFALTYGLASGAFRNLVSAFSSLASGLRAMAPLFVFYVFASGLYYSILFVFSEP